MPVPEETVARLAQIPNLALSRRVLLSRYTRFGIGGPAEVYVETALEDSFMDALRIARESASPYVVIGGGTNLIVADAGFPGIVLRFTASAVRAEGTAVFSEAGAELQDLVDFTVSHGLKGIETMTGIPGSVGAAVYGNAGAYGHSIMERVHSVRFFDGDRVRTFGNAECRFRYRESIFKREKSWIVFSIELRMDTASPAELGRIATDILKIRNQKYPVTMKCAGSIFKNLILTELALPVRDAVPERVIREGKVPSAYFLEEVGAKGMHKGDIRVADYHANLIYNEGHGSADDLKEVIQVLKARVLERFGFELEEEVQYVGFDHEGRSDMMDSVRGVAQPG